MKRLLLYQRTPTNKDITDFCFATIDSELQCNSVSSCKGKEASDKETKSNFLLFHPTALRAAFLRMKDEAMLNIDVFIGLCAGQVVKPQ